MNGEPELHDVVDLITVTLQVHLLLRLNKFQSIKKMLEDQ